MKDRCQIRDPLTDRWVKLDTRTGRIVARKKSPGRWANVPDIGTVIEKLPLGGAPPRGSWHVKWGDIAIRVLP